MKILRKIVDNISAIANSQHFEIGGILGGSENGVITDMIEDLPSVTSGCRFEYYPNIEFLNAQIENWAENCIEFLGLFHTHFSGSKDLSDADIKYIKTIMLSSTDIVKHLYFPIFTLPNNELTVYKAYFEGNDIVIDKDEAVIV